MQKSIRFCAFLSTYFSIFFISSCAPIHQKTKVHYAKMRHGIVRIEEKNSFAIKLKISSRIRGKALYQKYCLECHGVNGLGDGIQAQYLHHSPTNLQKLVKEVPNFKFFIDISQWQGEMPGWKTEFNEVDREDLVAYIKSF